MITHGDFTQLAEHYHHRPGYSRTVLDVLCRYLHAATPEFVVADIGAGTGKLTEDLAALGAHGVAVEPNDAMREKGMTNPLLKNFQWKSGSAEMTGLGDNSVDWVLMGSSFHWTNVPQALSEFRRVLKPGGHFTAIWNPRDIERSDIELLVEEEIRKWVPTLKRKSSGTSEFTANLEEKIVASGIFKNVFYLEAHHELSMSPERYRGVWQSVNDIQVQAGKEYFQKITDHIEHLLSGRKNVRMVYKTRAWTTEVVK